MAKIGGEYTPALAAMASMGDRLCACRVLGIPYPPPRDMVEQVRDVAQALLDYDRAYPAWSWRRWTLDNHDPGDEDRG